MPSFTARACATGFGHRLVVPYELYEFKEFKVPELYHVMVLLHFQNELLILRYLQAPQSSTAAIVVLAAVALYRKF